MKTLLVLVVAGGFGTVGYHSLTTPVTVDPVSPGARPPLGVVDGLQTQPVLQVLPPPTGLARYDPAWNVHAADMNLTCQVIHNGTPVQSVAFVKSRNVISVPVPNPPGPPEMVDFWEIDAGIEYWTGTINGQTVRLVHATTRPPGSPDQGSYWVTPLGNPGPRVTQGFYCSQTSLNPPAAVCDVSAQWSAAFGGGSVVFAFGP
jgi:hypothetical protein